ncbi:MAG: replication-relaxation family protein [Deltaproteobacteria bacterium]|nr:replication-relaxation family protein [Deltaproteobacteria bacterium]
MTAARVKRGLPRAAPRSILNERHYDALERIQWARFLSTGQVRRSAPYPSDRTAQRGLRGLLDHRLVSAHLQGEALQRETVFTVTARGLEALAAAVRLEGPLPPPTRIPRPQKLRHALAIRDVFCAYLVAEREGHLDLVDFHFDSDLAGDARFQAAGLVPDAVVVTERGGGRTTAGIEVDLGTEPTRVLRDKFDRWRQILSAATVAAAAAPTTLIVTAARPTRRATIQRLVEDAGVGAVTKVVLATELPGLLRADVADAPTPPEARAAPEDAPVRFRVL